MLANANMANYAGLVSDAGISMAGIAPGAAASDLLAQANLQYAGATPVNYGPVTGTPLANLGGEVVSSGSPFSVPTGQTGVDVAARELATSPTIESAVGGSADKAAIYGAGGYGAAASPAELAAAAGGAGAGSFLSNLLPKTPAELAALASGLGSVASGVIGASAAEKAAQTQADAAVKAAQIQQEMFNTINAQGAPYRASGYNALNQIGSMLPGQYSKYDASGKLIGTDTGTGYFTQQYGPEQFQKDIDPGYAFRLQQGQMANQRASNLAGGLIGGNALRGMQDYTQGMASQEYGNAFNRFQTQRSNIYNTLAGIAGIGQTAQGQANQLAQNNATAQGQLGVGAAAAQAAGQIGQAAGYGGAATGAGNAYLLAQLLKQNQGVALT